MSRLVIALDVDGVLSPWGQPSKKAAGYQKVDTHPAGTRWANPHRPLRMWLHPDHGPMLRDLAAELDATLAWCTSWNAEANTWIAPAIGLAALPVIDVGTLGTCVDGVHWKTPAVQRRIGDQPLVWLDDEFDHGDHDWATARSDAGHPTLLVDVAANVGITSADLAFVADWHRTLTSAGTAG